MSDCMIIRRGGGGQGFDPNGAVLKVVTSTGCAVTVTNSSAGYSKTHQQVDGYPRSNNADVTEHFFSIPASAFGTLTVVAANTYGTNTKFVTVNTAGNVYEALVSAPNILLNSEFGKQDGFSITAPYACSAIYDSDYKTYTLGAPSGGPYLFNFTEAYDVSPYSVFKITTRMDGNYGTTHPYYVYANDKDNEAVFERELSGLPQDVTESVSLTDKAKTPFMFGFRKITNFVASLIVSEIVLE